MLPAQKILQGLQAQHTIIPLRLLVLVVLSVSMDQLVVIREHLVIILMTGQLLYLDLTERIIITLITSTDLKKFKSISLVSKMVFII